MARELKTTSKLRKMLGNDVLPRLSSNRTRTSKNKLLEMAESRMNLLDAKKECQAQQLLEYESHKNRLMSVSGQGLIEN